MAYFHVLERGEPGIPGGGSKKWYAAVLNGNELNIDELTTRIEKMSTVNGADIRAVLYALTDVTLAALSRGEIVRLGDLGSMRLSLNSEGRTEKADVTAAAIRKSTIIFSPSKKLKEMLKVIKYSKKER